MAFVLEFDKGWLGGINYFRNLITSVYNDPKRTIDPILFVGRDADLSAIEGFPPVKIVRTSLLDRGRIGEYLRRTAVKRWGSDFLLDWLLRFHRVSALSHSGLLGKRTRTRVLYWIPDLQHLGLPAYFDERERAYRTALFTRACREAEAVIVSSEAAQKDLVAWLPWMKDRSEVLRFVPDVEISKVLPARSELEGRYGFTGPFLYVPNQFWAHKNHSVIVEALGILASRGIRPLIVSTGLVTDYRNENHYQSLCARVEDLGIESGFLRLGVVPYEDVLALMRNAICIINPSFFEGWSTTVEEARAFDQAILLSDIPVHREQSPGKSIFFDPTDPGALAEAIGEQWQMREKVDRSRNDDSLLAQNHEGRRIAFSRRYHEIVEGAMRSPVRPDKHAG